MYFDSDNTSQSTLVSSTSSSAATISETQSTTSMDSFFDSSCSMEHLFPIPTTEPSAKGELSNQLSSAQIAAQLRPGHSYVDVTSFLNFSQNEAARRLNIPSSTLSKRWREATVGRKWPYRIISKIDKEIQTLLKNAPHQDQGQLPPHIQESLSKLVRKKQEECKQVFIRLY